MLASGASPAFAQQLGTGSAIEVPVAQLVAGLALCTLIAFAAIILLKRVKQGRSGMALFSRMQRTDDDTFRRIKVLETQRLSTHADVCRFVSANREYVVITSAAGAVIVRDVELPDTPAAAGETEPGA